MELDMKISKTAIAIACLFGSISYETHFEPSSSLSLNNSSKVLDQTGNWRLGINSLAATEQIEIRGIRGAGGGEWAWEGETDTGLEHDEQEDDSSDAGGEEVVEEEEEQQTRAQCLAKNLTIKTSCDFDARAVFNRELSSTCRFEGTIESPLVY